MNASAKIFFETLDTSASAIRAEEKERRGRRRKMSHRLSVKRQKMAAEVGCRQSVGFFRKAHAPVGHDRYYAWARAERDKERDKEIVDDAIKEIFDDVLDCSDSDTAAEDVVLTDDSDTTADIGDSEILKMVQNGCIAVVLHRDYGGNWGFMNPRLAMDRRAILAVQNGQNLIEGGMPADEAAAFVREAIKPLVGDLFLSGNMLRELRIQWVPTGTCFRIREYDGYESIEVLNLDDWILA